MIGTLLRPGQLAHLRRLSDPSFAANENQGLFNQARNVPIPGLTGPTTPMSGMAQPNQPLPQAPVTPQPFSTNGPYGGQAAQLAGLLAPQQQIPQQPVKGLLGMPSGPIKNFKTGGMYGN